MLGILLSLAAMAADFDFSSASSEVVDLAAPLSAGVATEIWKSADIGQGTTYSKLKVIVQYEAISPDTSDPANTPYNFEMLAVVEQQQADGSWQELGRQNQPIRRLDTGSIREILVLPDAQVEEGIDQVIAGFGGIPVRLKSISRGTAEGTLRVRLFAIDYYPSGANPFDGVTFSVTGQRFD